MIGFWREGMALLAFSSAKTELKFYRKPRASLRCTLGYGISPLWGWMILSGKDFPSQISMNIQYPWISKILFQQYFNLISTIYPFPNIHQQKLTNPGFGGNGMAVSTFKAAKTKRKKMTIYTINIRPLPGSAIPKLQEVKNPNVTGKRYTVQQK